MSFAGLDKAVSGEEIIDIKKGNICFVKEFAQKLYGSPYAWCGSSNGVSKMYPGFEIESRKSLLDRNYKDRIVIKKLENEIKENLIYFATNSKAKYSEIDDKVKEIKKSLMWRLKMEATA